jgi:cytosine/adenosine deaminase-related metal-dependent hydrolase
MVLGNDGLSPSIADGLKTMHEAMHLRDRSPNPFGLDDLKNMLDEAYAVTEKTFGIKIGRLAPGYQADFLSIPYIPPTPMNQQNAFAHLYYGLFHAFRPRHVFAGGEQIVADYRLKTSIENKVRQSRAYAQKLWDAIGKDE